MKKIILGLGIATSLLLATPPAEVNLLNEVTKGEVIGSELELNKSEIKLVDGGFRWVQLVVGKVISNTTYQNALKGCGLLTSSDTSMVNRLYSYSISSYKMINSRY